MVGVSDDAPGRIDGAPAGPGPSRRTLLEALLVAFGCIAGLALRAPIATRQFWAEDGRVFFQGALDKGVARPFGDPYGGYFHFVPRLIGAITSIGPIRYAATTTWMMVALVVGWCAATVFLTSVPWLKSVAVRVTMAASLVLLPSMNDESIANAANLQFVLLFTALVLLIGTPQGRRVRVSGCALLVVTGLTTPLALALAPLAVWRVLRERPRRVDGEVASWAAGVTFQFVAIVLTRPDRAPGNMLGVRQIVTGYARRVGYLNFSPTEQFARVGPVMLGAILLALIIAATVIAFRRADRSKAFLMIAVPTTGLVLYTFCGVRLGLAQDLPPRYELVPAWCLVWAALAAIETLVAALAERQHLSPRASASVITAVCAGLIVSWLFHWPVDPYRSSGPTWGTSLSVATQQCHDTASDTVAADIMPTGGNPPDWAVELHCDKLP